MGKMTLGIQNEQFTTTELSKGDEEQTFMREFKQLYGPDWNLEKRYLYSRLSDILKGISIAKNELKDRTFGGFNCGANEIGWSPIRPGHVGLVGGSYAESDQVWAFSAATADPSNSTGFEYWIHSPAAATTAFKVHEDSCIIPLYIVEESTTPKIQTVKMDIGRSDVLPIDVQAASMRDESSGISLIPLPFTFWGPEMDVLVALQCKKGGMISPRLGGITVALGTFLDATVYTASTNSVAPGTVAST